MKTISVAELSRKFTSEPSINLIDVRSQAEYKAVHIEGVENIPVDTVLDHLDRFKTDDPVYVMCHGGIRSQSVCATLANQGLENMVSVEGGLQAWMDQTLPVIRSGKLPMPIMRQVMMIAGALIMTGVAANHWIHPNFIYLSGGVGLGLFYAGLSGNCYMTKVLDLMPWNK